MRYAKNELIGICNVHLDIKRYSAGCGNAVSSIVDAKSWTLLHPLQNIAFGGHVGQMFVDNSPQRSTSDSSRLKFDKG